LTIVFKDVLMPDKLVIVESPAKARTIEKYLGKGYKVLASVGHVRDLPESSDSVDVEHDFAPHYQIIPGKEQIIAQLRSSALKSEAVYMATDPDREGEAIAWHIVESIDVPAKIPVHRVTFTEITPNAVRQAIANPRDIDMSLVDAQQARRILDRLVGYGLSGVLWKRVRRGLSAGRVQSVALRMVVEREREIEAFVAQEYWSIVADLVPQRGGSGTFQAHLVEVAGKKLDKYDIANQDQATAIVADLHGAAWQVTNVKRADKRRNPYAPFTTSTLQQEASRKLGFSSKKTMALAQQLYEGVDIGNEGTVGLITYMRTDSVNVAREAQEEARAFIAKQYGAQSVPAKPNMYTTKARGAQEAHEAIRPTSALRTPAQMKSMLTGEQSRLYDLIWKRFIASQMTPAIFDSVTVDIAAGQQPTTPAPYTFRATGSVLKELGYLAVYDVSLDDGEEDEDSERTLPALSSGEMLDALKVTPNQHFTTPPPRFSDASLIKELEQRGIGRPSTYSSIVTTILDRKYVEQANKRFRPTMLGRSVNDLLVRDFMRTVDYEFTSDMEKRLDSIAEGDEQWVPVVREIYTPINAEIGRDRGDRVEVETGIPCPKCEAGMLLVKFGRQGEFLGCKRYPDCTFTSDFVLNERGGFVISQANAEAPVAEPGVECDKCGGAMVRRRGRFGEFLACQRYPECNGTRRIGRDGKPVAPPEPTGVTCPKCQTGELLARRGRFGRPFYGCQRYPDCDYIINDLAEVATYDPATDVKPAPRKGRATTTKAAPKRTTAAKSTATTTKAAPKRTTAAKSTATTTKAAPKRTTAVKSTATTTKATPKRTTAAKSTTPKPKKSS
jgi:DNA topoisomerase-1